MTPSRSDNEGVEAQFERHRYFRQDELINRPTRVFEGGPEIPLQEVTKEPEILDVKRGIEAVMGVEGGFDFRSYGFFAIERPPRRKPDNKEGPSRDDQEHRDSFEEAPEDEFYHDILSAGFGPATRRTNL